MPARASKPIRIGALVPMTGDVDAYAVQMRIGIETAISEINRAGGVLGRPLAVEYRGSETTPAVLSDRCRELIDDWGAIALIGPWAAAGRKYAARVLCHFLQDHLRINCARADRGRKSPYFLSQ